MEEKRLRSLGKRDLDEYFKSNKDIDLWSKLRGLNSKDKDLARKIVGGVVKGGRGRSKELKELLETDNLIAS